MDIILLYPLKVSPSGILNPPEQLYYFKLKHLESLFIRLPVSCVCIWYGKLIKTYPICSLRSLSTAVLPSAAEGVHAVHL